MYFVIIDTRFNATAIGQAIWFIIWRHSTVRTLRFSSLSHCALLSSPVVLQRKGKRKRTAHRISRTLIRHVAARPKPLNRTACIITSLIATICSYLRYKIDFLAQKYIFIITTRPSTIVLYREARTTFIRSHLSVFGSEISFFFLITMKIPENVI